MLLSVNDRIAILNILPTEGDIRTLRILQELRLELSFSEAENANLKLRTIELAPGIVQWDWNHAAPGQEKEIPFGQVATSIVVDALKERDRTKKLQVAHLSIWDRFVGSENEPVESSTGRVIKGRNGRNGS